MTGGRNLAPLALDGVRCEPLAERRSLVSAERFARPWAAGGSLGDFLQRLPSILAGEELRALIAALAAACRAGRPVVLGMGAHVIKVGLNPVIIDLMERGILGALALNGAGIIHDAELALCGRTSEDVTEALERGSFGMAAETAALLCAAVDAAGRGNLGLGSAVGRQILDGGAPYPAQSILAAGVRLGIPVTVHVALGTDILHMHPGFDPAAAGRASHRDFRLLAAVVAGMEGGVYLNAGSAVILPEVFLKALALARNLGHRVRRVTTANLDFIRHYRPMTNVVQRPAALGGKGYALVGHHEILIPLIAAGVIEALAAAP